MPSMEDQAYFINQYFTAKPITIKWVYKYHNNFSTISQSIIKIVHTSTNKERDSTNNIKICIHI